jgi:hypothetical protein
MKNGWVKLRESGRVVFQFLQPTDFQTRANLSLFKRQSFGASLILQSRRSVIDKWEWSPTPFARNSVVFPLISRLAAGHHRECVFAYHEGTKFRARGGQSCVRISTANCSDRGRIQISAASQTDPLTLGPEKLIAVQQCVIGRAGSAIVAFVCAPW